MTWGGLRGAVGLALAIYVANIMDTETSTPEQRRTGSLVLFHIGGVALLTLVINATTAEPLLRKLGMTAIPEAKEMLLANVRERLEEHALKVYREVVQDQMAEVHEDANHKQVLHSKRDVFKYVHILHESAESKIQKNSVLTFALAHPTSRPPPRHVLGAYQTRTKHLPTPIVFGLPDPHPRRCTSIC